MNINFKKVIMPMVVIALGIFGALSTNAMDQKKVSFVDRWGYTHLEGEGCVRDIMCSTEPGDPCKTVSGDQLFDLEIDGVSCPNPLNKKQ